MKHWRLPWWKAASSGLCAALILTGAGLFARVGASVPAPEFLVAVGGSGSVGFQPTLARPHGEPTDSGYADDVLASERSSWGDLRLVHFGCPGETTTTMLYGGDRCHDLGSELADIDSFLHSHSTTVLMTVDLGFNDVRPCMEDQAVDASCVTRALDAVHDQLSLILADLRAAGGSAVRIIGVGHYDPFLGDYLDGAAGQRFATESVNVISRLNDVLRATYTSAGDPMADVATPFEMTNIEPTLMSGFGLVPRNVAETCALTWMCAAAPLGPNTHPNDAGYRTIASAIVAETAGQ